MQKWSGKTRHTELEKCAGTAPSPVRCVTSAGKATSSNQSALQTFKKADQWKDTVYLCAEPSVTVIFWTTSLWTPNMGQK